MPRCCASTAGCASRTYYASQLREDTIQNHAMSVLAAHVVALIRRDKRAPPAAGWSQVFQCMFRPRGRPPVRLQSGYGVVEAELAAGAAREGLRYA